MWIYILCTLPKMGRYSRMQGEIMEFTTFDYAGKEQGPKNIAQIVKEACEPWAYTTNGQLEHIEAKLDGVINVLGKMAELLSDREQLVLARKFNPDYDVYKK